MTRAVAALALTATLLAPTPALAHGDNWRTNSYTKWHCISHYESTHRWRIRNYPYSGGLQVRDSTWRAYTGKQAPDYAYQASKRFQIKVAKRIAFHGFRQHAPQGLSAWAAWDICR